MATNPLRQELRATTLFGLAVVVLLLGGGTLWAVQAPIAGAVIANGVIGFAGSRRTVQHLEGGIISEILVKEGDRVNAGAVLLILDDTASRARADELRNRIRNLAAEESRLLAERAREAEIEFSHPILQESGDPEIAAILDQQRSHFAARMNNQATRREILEKRIGQIKKQINGLGKQLTGVQRQAELIREEASSVAELVEKGYERKPRLLALLRAEADVAGTEGGLIASIARGEEAIGETRMRINNLETEILEAVDERMTQVTLARVSAEKIYRETLDRLARTRVVSPIEGIVLNIRFKTVGGVIRHSEPILDIAPSREELIVNARIRPIDVDEISTGSSAKIAFSAYKQRYLERINGKVIHLPADAFEDEKTGERFYLVDVRIDAEHLREVASEVELTAGMPADVFITTTDRTVAQYLIQPIKRSFERAFREN